MAGLYNDLVDFIPDKVVTAFLLPDDLDEHAFSSLLVKLSVEYLLTGAGVKTAFHHRDDNIAFHALTFDIDVGFIYYTLRVVDS